MRCRKPAKPSRKRMRSNPKPFLVTSESLVPKDLDARLEEFLQARPKQEPIQINVALNEGAFKKALQMIETNQEPMNQVNSFPRPVPAGILTLASTLTPFDRAFSHILNVEGRSFTNHPADKGGPTKFGITQKTLSAWRGKNVSAKDVENLEESEAKQIYKAKYWDKANLGFLANENMAMVMMDQAVNRGVATAITMAQVMMNSQSKTHLQEDGVLGPKTKNAMELINPDFFCREFIQAAQHSYWDIVQRNQSQAVFFRGWLNRTHILQDMVTFGTSVGTPILAPAPDLTDKAPKKLNVLAPYNWAKGEIGTKEIAGSKDNAAIVEYHRYTTLKATDDETPWCSSFLCAAAEKNGFKSTRSAAAKSWRTYGVEGDGSVGDIVCLTRSGGNHVAFLARKFKQGDRTLYLLGGNQNNKVGYSEYDASRLVCFRRFVA